MSGSVATDVSAAIRRLREAGVPSPRVDVELLAAHAAGLHRGDLQLLVLVGGEWPEAAQSRFQQLLVERERRVPLQHLTGLAPFRGIELAVGPGVFLPRPETELLAGMAIAEIAATDEALAVDLCTGSGAVALALVAEVATVQVGAIEVDRHAYAWAERNVEVLGRGRVSLRLGDVRNAATLLPAFAGGCHVVTANPPYIPDDAVPRDREVAEHDPARALYGGPDGLMVLRLCVTVATGLLRPGGLLLLEHGEPQREGVAAVLQQGKVWIDIARHDDLTGRPRLTSARLAGHGSGEN